MSAQDQRYDEMTEAVATQRAVDAEAWDEMPVTTHPRDVVGGDVDELNIVGVLSELGVPVGPIEFEGKEDFIRGDDVPACCRGLDILGAVPGQIGLPMARRGLIQQQAAGFVQKNLPGGKSYLAMATKPLAALDFRGAVNKAQLVAKNAKMVAASLKNFKSTTPPKRVVGGDVEWVDIVGQEAIVTTEKEWNIQGGGPLLVGEAARVFDDLVGARPPAKKKKASQISDAEVRALARDLEKAANKLSSRASSFSRKMERKLARDKALQTRVVRASKLSKAAALTRLPTMAGKYAPASALRSSSLSARPASRLTRSTGAASKGVLSSVLGIIGQLFPGGTEETIGPDPYGGSGSGSGYDFDPYGGYVEPELPPGPPDYGVPQPPAVPAPPSSVAELPPLPPGDFIADPYPNQAVDDPTVYDSTAAPLPKGIVYNTNPIPWQGVGSATRFTGTADRGNAAREGYARQNSGVLAWDGGWGGSGYQWGGGNSGIMDGWYIWWNGNRDGLQYKKDEAGGGVEVYSKDLKERSDRSVSFGWGPLVGNPNNEATKHLRMDIGTGKTFWFWDQAPPSAKMPQELVRLNKLADEYKDKVEKAKVDYDAEVTTAKATYLQAVALAKSRKEEADRRAYAWSKKQEDMQREQAEFDAKQTRDIEAFDLQRAQQDAALEQQLMQQQAQQEAQLAQLDIQRQTAETQAYQQWLQSGGGQGAPQGYYDEGGNYEGSPFADLDQPQGGGSRGPFDDLTEGQVSDALSVYDEGQYGWED